MIMWKRKLKVFVMSLTKQFSNLSIIWFSKTCAYLIEYEMLGIRYKNSQYISNALWKFTTKYHVSGKYQTHYTSHYKSSAKC